MAEEWGLPGAPKKRLVKRVRSHLWGYGIRPKHTVWHATWSWAYAIADSYYHTHWPLASEIANQYVFLLLGYMQQYHGLKLPYRAGNVIPDDVRNLLAETPLALPDDANTKLIRIGHSEAK